MKSLVNGKVNEEYVIRDVETGDDELKNFLFTLGCFKGESVTIVSKLSENFIIAVNDARYSIDTDLAKVILV